VKVNIHRLNGTDADILTYPIPYSLISMIWINTANEGFKYTVPPAQGQREQQNRSDKELFVRTEGCCIFSILCRCSWCYHCFTHG